MAVPSVKMLCQNELLRIMREDINYQVQDGDNGVTLKPTAIVWKPTRVQKNRSYEQSNQLSDFPGIILSNPRMSPTLTTGGTMNNDETHYVWLAQLIDNDLWEDAYRIATWSKWIQQIRDILMFSCLNGVVPPTSGRVKYTSASVVSDIDENVWVRDGNFVEGLLIEVQTLEPRGVVV